MKNLQYAIEKSGYDEGISLCSFAYFAKYEKRCGDIKCADCPFNNNMVLIEETLLAEYKKITKVQHEILKKLKENNAKTVQMIKNKILIHQDNLDYFLSVLGIEIIENNLDYERLEIEDILANCEVIER